MQVKIISYSCMWILLDYNICGDDFVSGTDEEKKKNS